MTAKPKVTITNVEELFADEIDQLWSPAAVMLNWPPVQGLRAPSVTINVIAPASANMTIKELRAAHIQGARDVLNAALLSLEEPISSRASAKKRQGV
jgi:hypothetical protein